MPQYFSVPSTTVSTNFQNGELKYTGDNSNVAIEGKGFFEVRLPNGHTALTRDGEFHVNAQGRLVTKESLPVMGINGPINLNQNSSEPLSISSTGLVNQGSQLLGQLKVTEVQKPEKLTQISGGYFLAQDPANLMKPSTASLREGYLESANTNSLSEMASMMTAMRGFEANQHVIQIQDDRMSRTITDLGNPT